MIHASKILVLAPHTDDGELGCGGTIAKLCAEAKQVHYVAFSNCHQSLAEGLPNDTLNRECLKATHLLGLSQDHVTILDFNVRTFPLFRQEILDTLISLRNEIKPDLVFIPSSTDIHQDHGVIHMESLRAFKSSSILGYELPWNNVAFDNRFYISLTERDLKKKTEAIATYHSQSHRHYMQADFIRSLAKVRGVQSNHEFAEAFEVYRLIS